MREIDQSISFFMFPFTLNNKDEYSIIGIDNFHLPEESIWKPLNLKIEEDVFFPHIQSFLQKSVKGKEGELNQMKSCDLFIYSLDDINWEQNFLGDRNSYEMVWKGGRAEFFFPNSTSTFESPKLILYPDASVGILIIPIEMKRKGIVMNNEDTVGLNPKNMGSLMEFNYRMHKTDQQKPQLQFQEPGNLKNEYKRFFFEKMEKLSQMIGVDYDKQKEESLTFDLPTLVNSLLSLMGLSYSLTNRKRCHVLSYIHSKDDKDLTDLEKDDFLRISRCENHLYQIINGDNDIMQTFKNIYLAASVEGGAIMVNGNLDFFNGFKTDSLQKRYIWLYLLAIIQRYSLINMSKAIGEIDDTSDKRKIVSLQKLRDLSDRLTRVKVNTYFSDVSDYEQHNGFYHFCNKKLGVTRLLDDMEQKARTLGDCLKQKADKKSENFQLLLAMLVAFLTVFSGCNDGFELFKNLSDWNETHNPSLLIGIYWIVFGIFSLFFILMGVRYRKELKEIISDIVFFLKKHN